MTLTTDQKNILAAINLESSDPLTTGKETALLSDAQAIAKINTWLPTGLIRWQARQKQIQTQIANLTTSLNSANAVIASINAIKN